MPRGEPFLVRVGFPAFFIFELNEGTARVAFDHDAFAFVSENAADPLARLVRR